MTLKMFVTGILQRFGYRRVLLLNTISIGLLIMLFANVGPGTPIWQIIMQGFLFGFCASLQYSSMNTLAYADVQPPDASMASTIASTLQQMSMSFGVATASLVTAVFIPDRFHCSPSQLIHGIHLAFIALGVLTILSAAVFAELTADDGASISQKEAAVPVAQPSA
jgi:MFS family permease